MTPRITSTATRITAEYLNIFEPFRCALPVTEFPTGGTLTALFSESADGDATAIHAALADVSVTDDGTAYVFALPATTLVTHLRAYVRRQVFFHLRDNAGAFNETWLFRVVDRDPDLLPPPQ